MAQPSPAQRGNLRWLMVFMAFLATAINYIDRANMAVAAPFMAKDLGLSDTDVGWLLGAFFVTYAIFQLPSGWFIDKVGARIAYAVAVVWWSLFTALTAIGTGFRTLFGARLLLGAGEAPAYPSNAKVVSEWFPKSERAFATSIFDSGSRVGNVLALPIVTMLITAFGWRMSFVITGAIGIVWAVFWLWIYRPPRQHPWVSEAERTYIEAGAGAPMQAPLDAHGPRIRWADLFKYRTVWGMMLGFFCLNFVIYFFSTWFPTFLVRGLGFDASALRSKAMIPGAVAILGGYLGGWVSDRLLKSGKSLSVARKVPLVLGLSLSSVLGIVVLVKSTALAIALMSLSYASLAFAAASVWSLPADVAPTRAYVASIGGIQNFASNLAGLSMSLFVGKMLEKTGGFAVPMIAAGGMALLGAFSYLVIVRVAPLGSEGRVGGAS